MNKTYFDDQLVFHDCSNNEAITMVPYKNNEFIKDSLKSRDVILELGQDLSSVNIDKLKSEPDIRNKLHPEIVEFMIHDGNERTVPTRPAKTELQVDIQASKENFSCYISTHKKQRNLRCDYFACKHRFTNYKNLGLHKSCHRREGKKFICPFCKKDFLNWMNCAHHLWKDHQYNLDLFSCNVCHSYKAAIPELLRRHYQMHLNVHQHICKTCGKAFKQAPTLYNHELLHQKQMKKEKHRCSCDKVFTSEMSLKNHYQKCHTSNKLLICIVCNYRTTRHADFSLHQRIHTKEKPFNCHFCCLNFSDHNSLRRHKLTHMPIKHLRCPLAACSLETVHAAVLKKHFKQQHPTELMVEFNCLFCSCSSYSLQEFITHAAVHERELLSETREEE